MFFGPRTTAFDQSAKNALRPNRVESGSRLLAAELTFTTGMWDQATGQTSIVELELLPFGLNRPE